MIFFLKLSNSPAAVLWKLPSSISSAALTKTSLSFKVVGSQSIYFKFTLPYFCFEGTKIAGTDR